MVRRSSTIRDIRANALDKQAESAKMSTVYTTAKINQILDDIKKGKNQISIHFIMVKRFKRFWYYV